MKLKKHIRTILISAGLLMAFVLPLSAQNEPTGNADGDMAELTEDAPPPEKSLLDMIKAGGWAMWPLGLLSVATVGLAVYNGIALRKANFIDDEVITEVENSINSGDFESAREHCTNNPGPVTNTIGHVIDETLKGENVNPDSVEKAFEAASTKELTGPFVIVSYLSIIAAIAPMLGLLGTVSGMVKAFNAIAAQGMGQPDILADNISEALITTATGMTIGIPAMFFFFYFKNKYGKIVSDITLILGRFYGDIVRAKK
ncbi:MAG TPA: MotA/TolQ/ExbB proton channel family protein [Opitutales bacterium]|nr:MotA/TolQ/ExbB proton channel family protein [Opitutales bacterium]